MNKFKHTPGDWYLDEPCAYGIDIKSNSKEPEFSIWIGSMNNTLDGVNNKPTEEIMANARLAAAAPKMLEVIMELISIIKIHSKATGNNFAWAEVDEAERCIERATGLSIDEVLNNLKS